MPIPGQPLNGAGEGGDGQHRAGRLPAASTSMHTYTLASRALSDRHPPCINNVRAVALVALDLQALPVPVPFWASATAWMSPRCQAHDACTRRYCISMYTCMNIPVSASVCVLPQATCITASGNSTGAGACSHAASMHTCSRSVIGLA